MQMGKRKKVLFLTTNSKKCSHKKLKLESKNRALDTVPSIFEHVDAEPSHEHHVDIQEMSIMESDYPEKVKSENANKSLTQQHTEKCPFHPEEIDKLYSWTLEHGQQTLNSHIYTAKLN
jgi:hypothetical protein